MKLYDSNFWIAFFNKDDSQHKKAVAIMHDSATLAISEYCVAETTSILTFKSGKDTANRFLEYISDNADIEVAYSSQNFFDDAVRLFRTLDSKKLSFVDVSLLLLSRTYEIVTFDTALVKEIQKQKRV